MRITYEECKGDSWGEVESKSVAVFRSTFSSSHNGVPYTDGPRGVCELSFILERGEQICLTLNAVDLEDIGQVLREAREEIRLKWETAR